MRDCCRDCPQDCFFGLFGLSDSPLLLVRSHLPGSDENGGADGTNHNWEYQSGHSILHVVANVMLTFDSVGDIPQEGVRNG